MSAQKMTGITKEMYQAYKDRFAPEYEKTSAMMPVTQQKEDRSWKASNLSYLLPYADVTAPFKAGMQTIAEGKDTDETTAELYTKAFLNAFLKATSAFLSPSISAETAQELAFPTNGQFRTKSGSLIADWKNDPDWLNKIIYHTYRKITPTTIRSAEEILQAIGGDLSKAGIKRDLFDTVVKVFTGYSVQKQDPYTAMRFKLGKYSGDLRRVNEAFINDIANAGKLKNDAELLSRGLPGETFPTEYETKQSNSYRVLSEVYKDVQALRVLNFTEKEIKDLLKGRRALSDKDVNNVMLGIYTPDNIPNFKKDGAIRKVVDQINKELETNFTVNDFVDRGKLIEIKNKYNNIPLGLSNEEREQFLRTTIERKAEDKEPLIEEQQKLQEKQLEDLESKAQPVVPASPFLPDPQIANMFAANVDPTTGLTQTETALYSPEEQIIAKRLRT